MNKKSVKSRSFCSSEKFIQWGESSLSDLNYAAHLLFNIFICKSR